MARGRFLVPGDEIVTRVEGVGELRNRCVASDKEEN
jgi:2-keto-4-pentenoate hydratase/2-oxohepta-3-ene-1,7-dioic acid hydratase in catechol pathway